MHASSKYVNKETGHVITTLNPMGQMQVVVTYELLSNMLIFREQVVIMQGN